MSKSKLLKERVKELTCLYTISNLNEYELSVQELLQSAVECLPEAMQNSEYCAGCIEFNGEEFTTDNFTPSKWMLTECNDTLRKHKLSIHVVYHKELPHQNGSPFLREEKEMIRSIAYQLSLKIDRIYAKNEIQEKQLLLNRSYELSGIGTWELDVQDSVIYWSPFIKELHGIDPDVNLNLEDAFKLVKEGESRQIIQHAMARSIKYGDTFDIEVELITGDGDFVWTRIVGESEFEDGACTRLYGTLQNIQKKKQAELLVQQGRAKLQKIMNQSPDVICTADAEGRFVEVSRKCMAAWGYTSDEMEGRAIFDFIHEDDIEKSRKAFKEIVAGREMNNFENQHVHKNGSHVPIIWSAKWDENDQLIYCVARDGTEKKRAENELKQYNRFIETAIESLPIGIVAYDIETGKTQLINNKYCEICGWSREELSDGEKAYELLFPEEAYRNKIRARVSEDIGSGDLDRMAWEGLKITTKNGVEKKVQAKNIPIYEQNLMISTLIDITEQKKMEQQLIENEKRFKALVQDGSDLLAIFDQNGIYKYVSPTSENILGIKPEHFVGKDLLQFVHEKDKSKIIRVIKNLPELKRFKIPLVRFRDVNYNWRWLETTITNMTNEQAVKGYVANSRDVTERVRQQKILQESLEEKEVLLSEIHHRVKNNLAIISGILQLQAYDEENEQVLERLYDSIFRIQTMASIHELLYQTESFSRLLFSEIIDKLIYGIHETLRGGKEIDINISQQEQELNINQAIPCSLIINEVVTNVYKHAFKGRKKGILKINVREQDGVLYLKIADNGIGLPEGLNAKESTTLGMNIIRILSSQLEAEYKFESSVEGTTFELEFARINLEKKIMNSRQNLSK